MFKSPYMQKKQSPCSPASCDIEYMSSSLSPSLTLTLVAKSTGAWSELARRAATPCSYTLRRLSRRSVLELRLVKLIITTVLALLVVFVVVLVSVTLESVRSRVRRALSSRTYRCRLNDMYT
jgi:hypothetical protein